MVQTDSTTWLTVDQVCGPSIVYNSTTGIVTAPICASGQYAVVRLGALLASESIPCKLLFFSFLTQLLLY